MITALFLIVLLTVLTAVYVAAEFAFVGVRQTRIEELAAKGSKLASMVRPLVSSPARLDAAIAACQIGITLASLVLGAYGQATLGARLAGVLEVRADMPPAAAQSLAAAVVLLGLVAFQVVFGELFPKSLAMRYPSTVAMATVLPLRWSMGLFSSFIWLLNGSSNLLLALMRVPAGSRIHVHGAAEIDLLVTESHEGGMLDEAERERLHNVFRLASRRVREVMVPRTQVFAVDVNTPPDELMGIAADSAYTRIPVYEDNLDNVLGVIHVKDLLAAALPESGAPDLREVLREVPRVLENIYVGRLLSDMRARHIQMSVVVDEYGGTSGIVTLEDLLEEVVGDIPDEYDKGSLPTVAALPDGRFRIPGRMLITDVNERLGLNLEHLEADTIGGLFMGLVGRVPEPGDTVEVEGCCLEVEEVGEYTVETLLLTLVNGESGGTTDG